MEQKHVIKDENITEKDYFAKIFSERMREARKSHPDKPTQQSLALSLNSSPSYICSLEKGELVPGIANAAKIAECLGVSLDWLCGLNDETLESDDNKAPWNNIPITYALLAFLGKYVSLLDVGDGVESPIATLTVNCMIPDIAKNLKGFFEFYHSIRFLERQKNPSAELIDMAYVEIAKKYKDKL